MLHLHVVSTCVMRHDVVLCYTWMNKYTMWLCPSFSPDICSIRMLYNCLKCFCTSACWPLINMHWLSLKDFGQMYKVFGGHVIMIIIIMTMSALGLSGHCYWTDSNYNNNNNNNNNLLACVASWAITVDVVMQLACNGFNCSFLYLCFYVIVNNNNIDWLIDCFTAHQHRKAISAKKRY